ncbi:MAG: transglutaminase family protein, partial [Bacteroidia bacterium]|nr:transglutaminase family protein [Bacteroidia bacterium]
MEIRFFIKEKGQESGPYNLSELGQLKLKKNSLVRPEGNEEWKKAKFYSELDHLTNKTLGSAGTFILVVILIFVSYYVYRQLYPPKAESMAIAKENSTVGNYDEDIDYSEEDEFTAPEIEYNVTKHQKKLFREMFKDCNKPKRVLVKACNYSNETVRNFAAKVAGNSPGNFNISQVCDLFDYCYSNWKYVNDPRTTEYVSKASETIRNELNGDCDDFAVLMCSSILAVGGEARVNYAWGSEGGHAFTEVNLGKESEEFLASYIGNRYSTINIGSTDIYAKRDKEGNIWLNLDWWAENPGGEYFDYKVGYTFYILQKFCENIDAST